MDHLAGQRGFFCQRAGFDLMHHADHLDGVLIHCIAVIHIKLHHPDNAPEIRQQLAQIAGFIHQAKHPHRAGRAGQNLQ